MTTITGQRKYRKVFPRLWDNRRFKRLTEKQKVIFFYLLSGPQTNRIGFYRLRAVNAAHDCGVSLKDFLADLRAICGAFDWRYDPANDVLLVTTWWEYNAPESQLTMLGYLRDLAELPGETPLWSSFKAESHWFSLPVRDIFDQTVPKYDSLFHAPTASVDDDNAKGMPRVSGGYAKGQARVSGGLGKGMPTQEQEQEQEQEQAFGPSAAKRTAEKNTAENGKTREEAAALGKAASWFIARFVGLFSELRGGAKYVVTPRDGNLVKHLLGTHEPERLLKLARLMLLVEDDEFIVGSARDITILNAKVNYLEARLAETEVRRARIR